LVREVLERAGREAPADRVLKDAAKRARDLSSADRREAARAVFEFYRWRGWMGDGGPIAKRIAEARALAERYEQSPASFKDPELLERAVPAWVWQEMAPDVNWCRMLQRPPVLWLRARRGQREALSRELGHCTNGPVGLPDSLRYDGVEDLFRTPAFVNGRVEIHDLSSQAVGGMCGVRPGEHWWDVCAGEGGKTIHLAAMMEGRGVVWATDRSSWRLARLKRRAARAEVFNYQAMRWAAGEPVPFKVEVDGALVDAPCSGLGTWHRNPHGRWTVQPGDLGPLAELQQALLLAAADRVKRGGRLVYSVCTMTRRETGDIVRAFEGARPDFEPLDVAHAMESARTGSRHWLKPWVLGGNGMFVAVWRRRKPSP
jgi:16S rRNA (cytosine967-C5)-methyltransferase